MISGRCFHTPYSEERHGGVRAKTNGDGNEEPSCAEVQPVDRDQSAAAAEDDARRVGADRPQGVAKTLRGEVQAHTEAIEAVDGTNNPQIRRPDAEGGFAAGEEVQPERGEECEEGADAGARNCNRHSTCPPCGRVDTARRPNWCRPS